jgi:hypothetical protein
MRVYGVDRFGGLLIVTLPFGGRPFDTTRRDSIFSFPESIVRRILSQRRCPRDVIRCESTGTVSESRSPLATLRIASTIGIIPGSSSNPSRTGLLGMPRLYRERRTGTGHQDWDGTPGFAQKYPFLDEFLCKALGFLCSDKPSPQRLLSSTFDSAMYFAFPSL